LVGISSYLLVNFWYTRIQANKSAISALLMNRVGDMFLTIGLFAMISTFGNLDYGTVFSLAFNQNQNIITIIGILLLLGAMAKSAQLGLHVWLPQAMEGWMGLSLNFTICGKILKQLDTLKFLGKSAGNFMGYNNMIISENDFFQHKSSLETRRETFNNIYNKPLSDKFKYWFIGFTEGDGSFLLNKDKYLEFKITQSSKNYIKRELGFGMVRAFNFIWIRNNKKIKIQNKQEILNEDIVRTIKRIIGYI
jgi:proton-conducting membrane transporter